MGLFRMVLYMIIEGLIGGIVDYLEYKQFADVYVVEDKYSVQGTSVEGMYVSLEDLVQFDCIGGELYRAVLNVEFKLGAGLDVYEGYSILDEVRRDLSYSRFQDGEYYYIVKGVDTLRGKEGTLRSRLYIDIEREY